MAVQQTLQGDAEAFTDIVQRYSPLLYSLSYRFLGSQEEAEDAVQEIFVRAFRSLHHFSLRARFYTWIYTIGLNWLRSCMRKRGTERRHGEPPFEGHESIRDHVVDPADALVRKEEERLIHVAIRKLPPIYREAFVLRHLEGMPMDDIATILKVPPGTVRVRLHRGKKRMIEFLTDEPRT